MVHKARSKQSTPTRMSESKRPSYSEAIVARSERNCLQKNMLLITYQ
jgi:hypothetical protein